MQLDIICVPHNPYVNTTKRMLVGNRDNKGLTRITINAILPSLLQFMGTSKCHPQGSEPPVARTGQHLWFRPGWTMLIHKLIPSIRYEDNER